MKKVEHRSELFYESDDQPLAKKLLTEGFALEKADKNIHFTRSGQEAVRIDLEESQKDEYVPRQYQMDARQLQRVRELFLASQS